MEVMRREEVRGTGRDSSDIEAVLSYKEIKRF